MNGPKLWAEMLTAINIPGAVVAGGCIRDCFLSLEPKDIDIFVPCANMDAWLEVKYKMLSENTSMADLLDTQEGKEYEKTDFSKERNPLYGVLEGQLMGYTVNIIARTSHTSPEELISLFDFGFLQMYYTEQTGVIDTPASRYDRYTKRYTMQHDSHVEQSIGRWLRFNNRHPGLLALDLPFEFNAELVSVVPAENQLELIL